MNQKLSAFFLIIENVKDFLEVWDISEAGRKKITSPKLTANLKSIHDPLKKSSETVPTVYAKKFVPPYPYRDFFSITYILNPPRWIWECDSAKFN